MIKRKSTNNDLQNITHKTKDRVTWTTLKTRSELRCSGRVSSSCSTSGTRRVNLVTNSVINHEWGKDREVFTTSETYPRLFARQTFHMLYCWHLLLYLCYVQYYIYIPCSMYMQQCIKSLIIIFLYYFCIVIISLNNNMYFP